MDTSYKVTKYENYYIKEIESPREYNIAKETETLSLPTFQKVMCLVPESETKYYMMSTEIKGRKLHEMVNEISREDLENILKTIFFSLRVAYEHLGFVHCDLHLGNIIIQKIDETMEIRGSFGDLSRYDLTLKGREENFLYFENKIIVEKYVPVLIDFEYAMTDRYPSDVYASKTILHDIWRLLGSLSLYATKERGELVLDYIEYFMDRYEFQERKEEFVHRWFSELP